MKTMTIGQLAKQAGVHLETVRYYERRGLIPEPPRRDSGYREYPPETAERIHFIKRAQELGFSLEEILELLTLRVDSRTPCGKVRKRAEQKVANVDAKIGGLQKMRRALVKLVSACRGRGPVSECPILEALSSNP